MRYFFLTLVLFFQINEAFAYNEDTLREKLDSLDFTFVLQSKNFYSENEKMYKLSQDPNVNPDHMYMLYHTTYQSLCIAALAVEKTQSLIKENPQIIGGILTKDKINGVNSTANAFERFLKEFDSDTQECKNQMPYTYDSINKV